MLRLSAGHSTEADLGTQNVFCFVFQMVIHKDLVINGKKVGVWILDVGSLDLLPSSATSLST